MSTAQPVLRTFFIIASLFVAHAVTAQPNPSSSWPDDPRREVVERLWSNHRVGLLYEADTTWTLEEVRALERGAEALPAAMIAALEEPTFIRRVHHGCLFGIGRDTSGCPTYDDDGNFLLYDLPPLQGEGPVMRLAPLEQEERDEIQRRRAVVHALVRAYDEISRWSDSKRWRSINGWRSRRQAMNRDTWGFSRYYGARSPRSDLVTFAEEWFVRPEDVIAAPRRDAIDPDMSVECQEFTKSRFFARRIALLDPTWHRRGADDRRPDQQCPAFESWAQLHNLEAVDVLVAAATADRPESLYGHLLLHVRYHDRSEGFEPVYQFGAVTDTNVDPLTYFSRGLLGGFLTVLDVNSFRGVDRIFLQYEQRGLRRYELMLSPVQTRRLMERLWEYERRVRYPYYFFSNNCASFLIDLVGPALDLDVPDRSHLVVAPTDVLDYFAAVENGPRGPLLRKRPEVEFSSREVAQVAVRERRIALDRLIEALGGGKTARELRRLDRQVDDRDPGERAEAYERLRERITDLLTMAPRSAAPLALDYFYEAARMERYFAEVMFFRVREIKRAALLEPQHYTAEELLERRRELFAHEDHEERFAMLLRRTEEADRRLREGPHRELTTGEREELALARQTDEAYTAVLDAEASIIENFMPDFDGVAYVEAREEELVARQRARDELAVGPSGKGRIALGGGAASADLSTVHGSLFASYSFIWERLGEQRRRGFRSDIETRALGLEVWIPTTDRFYEAVDIDLNLFRFMTIEQRLGAVRDGFFDLFGWGVDLRAGHDGRRGVDLDGEVSGGLVFPLWQSDHAANHLVLGTWADARVQLTDVGRVSLLGGDAFLRLLLHLGGVYANSLRLEIGSRHFAAVETQTYEWEHRMRLATEHATWWVGQHPLVVSPWITAEWTTLDYLDEERDFKTLRVGVTVELPL